MNELPVPLSKSLLGVLNYSTVVWRAIEMIPKHGLHLRVPRKQHTIKLFAARIWLRRIDGVKLTNKHEPRARNCLVCFLRD